MSILYGIWVWFASNILTKPAYFIGLIVLIGYILQKKTWYDSLGNSWFLNLERRFWWISK